MIYKIFRLAEWQATENASIFPGSPDDLRDGFVHLSTAEQVQTTCDKHFSAERSLVLAAVDEGALSDLRWEVSRGGARFPHLYGPLPLSAIRWRREIHRAPDGGFIFPPEIP